MNISALKNPVAQVPAGLKAIGYTDVTTADGRVVRLFVSEPWVDRMWALQVMVAIDQGDACPGETLLPNDPRVLGEVRVFWSNPARMQKFYPTLGDLGHHQMGMAWTRSEEALLKWESGSSWKSQDPAAVERACHSEREGVWERIWREGLLRNVAWMDFLDVRPDATKSGIAGVLYPAMADIMSQEGVILLHPKPEGLEAETKSDPEKKCLTGGYWARDEMRCQILPEAHQWQMFRPIVREEGGRIIPNPKNIKVPKLPAEVRLDVGPEDLLAKLTPKRIIEGVEIPKRARKVKR